MGFTSPKMESPFVLRDELVWSSFAFVAWEPVQSMPNATGCAGSKRARE